jgi:hypothetical protein
MFLPAYRYPRQQGPGRPPRQGIAASAVEVPVLLGHITRSRLAPLALAYPAMDKLGR